MSEEPVFKEDKAFTLRFSLEASFPDEYEGEEDERRWLKEWEQQIKPEMIKAVFDSLRRHPGWKTHIRNRGASPLDEVEIAMEKDFSGPADDGNPLRSY